MQKFVLFRFIRFSEQKQSFFEARFENPLEGRLLLVAVEPLFAGSDIYNDIFIPRLLSKSING